MAVGAVSSEPVSHVDKRTKNECESPGSVPEYPASESSIDSASSSRRLKNAIEQDFIDQTSCTTILSADPRTSLTPRKTASHLSRVERFCLLQASDLEDRGGPLGLPQWLATQGSRPRRRPQAGPRLPTMYALPIACMIATIHRLPDRRKTNAKNSPMPKMAKNTGPAVDSPAA